VKPHSLVGLWRGGAGQPSPDAPAARSGKLTWTDIPVHDHKEAIQLVLDTLVHPEHGVIASVQELEAVGHRVVHGGSSLPRRC